MSPPSFPPRSNSAEPKWIYERGEGRRKHCWNKAFAGFRPAKRGQVGKCANVITDEVAQDLLNSGFWISPEDGEMQDYPDEIFNVHRGVVYVAVPTRPGISFHGYPYKGRMPKRIHEELRLRAKEQGFEKEFDKWSSQHLSS